MIYLQYVIQLYRGKNSDKRLEAALNGFLQSHGNSCIVPTCPIKKKAEINSRIQSSINNFEFCENYQDYQVVILFQKEF